ncbi:MFS transporter [Paraburkholderia bengalensis]|uniref:MFS transporter n=1 Tax=Paraburkholderia bengalensis TaxID=2747562 RepID=A0ABU8J2F2_9BURK
MNTLRLRILAVFSYSYFISYVFRGVNLGFAPFLARELGLTASDLGALTSAYFLGFAIAQIPAGVLLDRYGPRRVTASVISFAVVGALIFASSHNVLGMMLGRLMIGAGVSVCLVGAFKATAQHFEIAQLPLVNGIVTSTGGIGGVVVGAPLSLLMTLTDWRTICFSLAGLTALAAAMVLIGAPSDNTGGTRASVAEQFLGSLNVLRSKTFWKLTSFPGLAQAAFYAMQSLWVGAFLRDVVPAGAGSATRVGTLVSVLGTSFIVGNIGFGIIARLLNRHGIRTQHFAGSLLLLFIAVQAVIAARVEVPETLLWAMYGALGSTGFITYAVLPEYYPVNLIGRVNTAYTLVIFIGVFVVQVAVGNVLGYWPEMQGHHPAVAHQIVWASLTILQIFAALWYFAPAGSSVKRSASSRFLQ